MPQRRPIGVVTLGFNSNFRAVLLLAACRTSKSDRLLAQVKAAEVGDWSRIWRYMRVCGYVTEFFKQPKVVGGAAELMVQALGAAAKRGNVPVVSDAIFEPAD